MAIYILFKSACPLSSSSYVYPSPALLELQGSEVAAMVVTFTLSLVHAIALGIQAMVDWRRKRLLNILTSAYLLKFFLPGLHWHFISLLLLTDFTNVFASSSYSPPPALCSPRFSSHLWFSLPISKGCFWMIRPYISLPAPYFRLP